MVEVVEVRNRAVDSASWQSNASKPPQTIILRLHLSIHRPNHRAPTKILPRFLVLSGPALSRPRRAQVSSALRRCFTPACRRRCLRCNVHYPCADTPSFPSLVNSQLPSLLLVLPHSADEYQVTAGAICDDTARFLHHHLNMHVRSQLAPLCNVTSESQQTAQVYVIAIERGHVLVPTKQGLKAGCSKMLI